MGTILNYLLGLLLVSIIISIVNGFRLYKKNKLKFEESRGFREYIVIVLTLFFAIVAILSSTADFSNVIQRIDNILSIFNRKPILKIEFDIDPNDTTYEITNIKLKNNGDLLASVYMMKIVMPNKGFQVINPKIPIGFEAVFTYDKDNSTFQRIYYPPKSVLPGDSSRQLIDMNRCDIVYDKHLNRPFSVFVYYQAEFGHDGWVDTTIIISKP